MTPVEKAGYTVGQRFEITSKDAFTLGSIVELERDDQSSSPLFKLITGGCNFAHSAGGALGAYASLERVRPLVAFKTGDKLTLRPDWKTIEAAKGHYTEQLADNEVDTVYTVRRGPSMSGFIPLAWGTQRTSYAPAHFMLLEEKESQPSQSCEELVLENVSLEKQLARLVTERDALSSKIEKKLEYVAQNTAAITRSIPESIKRYAKYL